MTVQGGPGERIFGCWSQGVPRQWSVGWKNSVSRNRRQLNLAVSGDCIKRKSKLVLYQDPATHAPAKYSRLGSGYRNPPRTGKWTVVKGGKTDPNAKVYQLDPDLPRAFLSLLEADENALFFLGRKGNHFVGNIHFSYTLNRAVMKGTGSRWLFQSWPVLAQISPTVRRALKRSRCSSSTQRHPLCAPHTPLPGGNRRR